LNTFGQLIKSQITSISCTISKISKMASVGEFGVSFAVGKVIYNLSSVESLVILRDTDCIREPPGRAPSVSFHGASFGSRDALLVRLDDTIAGVVTLRRERDSASSVRRFREKLVVPKFVD